MLNLNIKTQTVSIQQSLNQKVLDISKTHQDIIKNTAADMQAYLTQSLSISVQGAGWTPTRSLAGQVPRRESGKLAENTKVICSTSGDTINIHALSNTPYAKYLEYGSINTSPRPFLLPTLNKFKTELKTRIKNIWSQI